MVYEALSIYYYVSPGCDYANIIIKIFLSSIADEKKGIFSGILMAPLFTYISSNDFSASRTARQQWLLSQTNHQFICGQILHGNLWPLLWYQNIILHWIIYYNIFCVSNINENRRMPAGHGSKQIRPKSSRPKCIILYSNKGTWCITK